MTGGNGQIARPFETVPERVAREKLQRRRARKGAAALTPEKKEALKSIASAAYDARYAFRRGYSAERSAKRTVSDLRLRYWERFGEAPPVDFKGNRRYDPDAAMDLLKDAAATEAWDALGRLESCRDMPRKLAKALVRMSAMRPELAEWHPEIAERFDAFADLFAEHGEKESA